MLGYARVDLAPNGHEADSATATLALRCAREGWSLIEVIHDGKQPGQRLAERPGLGYALRQIRSGVAGRAGRRADERLHGPHHGPGDAARDGSARRSAASWAPPTASSTRPPAPTARRRPAPSWISGGWERPAPSASGRARTWPPGASRTGNRYPRGELNRGDRRPARTPASRCARSPTRSILADIADTGGAAPLADRRREGGGGGGAGHVTRDNGTGVGVRAILAAVADSRRPARHGAARWRRSLRWPSATIIIWNR